MHKMLTKNSFDYIGRKCMLLIRGHRLSEILEWHDWLLSVDEDGCYEFDLNFMKKIGRK